MLWPAVALSVVPTLFLYAVSLAAVPTLHPRYLYPALPGYCLLLVALAEVSGRIGRRLIVLGMLPLGMVTSALSIVQARYPTPARELSTLIAPHATDGDGMVAIEHMPIGWQFSWEWRYRLHRREPVAILETGNNPWATMMLPGVTPEALPWNDVHRIWALGAEPRGRSRLLRAAEAHGFALRAEFPVRHPNLMVLERVCGADTR
jgi:hypothetical protein